MNTVTSTHPIAETELEQMITLRLGSLSQGQLGKVLDFITALEAAEYAELMIKSSTQLLNRVSDNDNLEKINSFIVRIITRETENRK